MHAFEQSKCVCGSQYFASFGHYIYLLNGIKEFNKPYNIRLNHRCEICTIWNTINLAWMESDKRNSLSAEIIGSNVP